MLFSVVLIFAGATVCLLEPLGAADQGPIGRVGGQTVLAPHILSTMMDPIPETLDDAWTAFKDQNGLDYTKNPDEEKKRKRLFKITYDSVMATNKSNPGYKSTIYYPNAIETDKEKRQPMKDGLRKKYNDHIAKSKAKSSSTDKKTKN